MKLSEFGAPFREQDVRLARRSNIAILGERDLARFPLYQCLCLLHCTPHVLHFGRASYGVLQKVEGKTIRDVRR
jgi:hypothetical protein